MTTQQWQKLKLGAGTGLVIGMAMMGVGGVIGFERIVKSWEALSELLAITIGIIYTLAYAKLFVAEKDWLILVTKYERFLLLVVITFMLSMVLVTILVNLPEQIRVTNRVLELFNYDYLGRGLDGLIRMMVNGVGVALKWSILGLMVVFGYRLIMQSAKIKKQNDKI